MRRAHRKLLRIVAPVALWLALGCTAIPIHIPQADGGSLQDAPKWLYDSAAAETGALPDLMPPGSDGPISIGDGGVADGGRPPPGDAGPDGQATDGLVDGLPIVPDGLPTDGLLDGVSADGLPDAGADSGLPDTTVGEGV
jgi:hypothetical protein